MIRMCLPVIDRNRYEQMTAAPKMAPQNPDADNGELDAHSLSAIRSILTEEEPAAPRRVRGKHTATPKHEPVPRSKAEALPEIQAAEAPATPASSKGTSAKSRSFFGVSFGRKAAALGQAPKAQSPEIKTPRRVEPAASVGLIEKVRSYRPTRAHLVFAAFAALILFRLWLVFGILFLIGFIMVGVLLITGYDGFWQGIIRISRWYTKRRPERAEAVYQKLDRFAVRWDAILDRFPEGTVDGLYLPDFGELATVDQRHEEAMDRRMAGLSENGA